MLTIVSAATGEVLTGRLPVCPPAGIVTLGGTWATRGSLLAGTSVTPPAGAGSSWVTVPVIEWPPATHGCGKAIPWTRTADGDHSGRAASRTPPKAAQTLPP